MTFDKAFEKVEQLANFEIGKTTGDIRRDFKLELGDVRDMLTELRQEYAPTVEMAHQQAKIFAYYYHPEKPLNKNKFYYPDSLIMKSISEKDLVQAWLHPETIKVVDE